MTTLRSAEANSITAPTITPGVLSEMKARQSAKIRELGQALIDAGVRTLDAQADALGLRRSTAWTILKTRHKGTGLSAAITERMLRSSKLPPRARAILVEYVEEKSFGLYGGSRRQQQRFCRSPVQHYRKLVGLRGNTPGTCTPHCSGRSCLCAERYPMAGMDVVLDPCLHHCVRARWRMRTARASASVES
jgi:hypothetical protein